jgi:chemotaxis family two-component system response regulator Rcp1
VPSRVYRILVVEDNPGDLYIIGEAFKECGYSCELTIATSHQEARHKLDHQTFDLILADFGTSIPEATNFVQYVRTHAPRVPIIILSGTHDPNPAYDAGAHAFVRKVADLQDFFNRINGIMRFWLDIAELPNHHGELHPTAIRERTTS